MDDKGNPVAWFTEARGLVGSGIGLHRGTAVVETLIIAEQLRRHGLEGKPCYRLEPKGKFLVGSEDVRKALEDLGFRAFLVSSSQVWMIHPDGGVADLDMDQRDPDQPLTVTAIESLASKIMPLLVNWFAEEAPPDEDHDSIYALQVTPRGAGFRVIGPAARELRRINYEQDVLADFDYIVKELDSTDPGGRLVVMLGKPGGGKTFLTRGIMAAARKPRYVLVNAHDVKKMTGPSILPALMEFTDEAAFGRPICFVIEDADECLVPRSSEDGNLSLISSLLNVTDGIMGSAFDIRVIASSNAEKVTLDDALVRSCRLCRRPERIDLRASTHIGPLSKIKAAEIFASLFEVGAKGPAVTIAGKMMLSDVYELARTHGWTSPPLADPSGTPHPGRRHQLRRTRR